jgi:hypothetical protein
MKRFDPSAYLNTPFFCEENIWHLARSLIEQGQDPKSLDVLFLANSRQRIVMAHQKQAAHNRLVMWDYHVVLLSEMNDELYVFDFDTRLGFPCPVEDYFLKSIPAPEILGGRYLPGIRMIPASSYLENFCSDRSHMIGHLAPEFFPGWPMICCQGGGREIFLRDYLDMSRELMDGSMVIYCEKGRFQAA